MKIPLSKKIAIYGENIYKIADDTLKNALKSKIATEIIDGLSKKIESIKSSDRIKKAREGISKAIAPVLLKIRPKKRELTPGMDIPCPPRISRTTLDDITEKETVKTELQRNAETYLGLHPFIGPDSVSVEVTRDGYNKYTASLAYNNAIAGPGKRFIFWRWPDVHNNLVLEAMIAAQKDDEELRKKNIEIFEKHATKNLRVSYVPQDIADDAIASGIPPALIADFFEKRFNKTKKRIAPEIDYEKEGRNTIIIKVSYKTDDQGRIEDSFEVIEDQIEGTELWNGRKGFSELAKELDIPLQFDATREEKVAAVLAKLSEKYNAEEFKDKCIFYEIRDESSDGRNATSIGNKMGISEIHPIFDYEAVQKVKGMVKIDPYKKAKKAAVIAVLGLAGLAATSGILYQSAKWGTVAGQKIVAKIAEKKAAAPAQEATGKVSKEVSRKTGHEPTAETSIKYENGMIKFNVVLKDPKGLEGVVVKATQGKETRQIIKQSYGRNATIEEEKYIDGVGSSGFWRKGKKYKIELEIMEQGAKKPVKIIKYYTVPKK